MHVRNDVNISGRNKKTLHSDNCSILNINRCTFSLTHETNHDKRNMFLNLIFCYRTRQPRTVSCGGRIVSSAAYLEPNEYVYPARYQIRTKRERSTVSYNM